jgi:hypothetical protein
VAWLLFADQVPRFRPEGSGLVPALFDLGSVVGEGALLATVSFLAYLIGALLLLPLEGRVATRLLDAIRPGVQETRVAHDEYQDLLARLRRQVHDVESRLGGDRARELINELDRSPSREGLRTRLLVASESLYGEYDRLSAEAAFRVNIAPPLVALSWIVGSQAGLAWGLVGTALSILLASQGVRRGILAGDILRRAVVAGVIELPAAADIRQAVAELR